MTEDKKTVVGWATRLICHVRALDVEGRDTIILYGTNWLLELPRSEWEQIGSPMFTEVSIEGAPE
jgi:hypothetical protein